MHSTQCCIISHLHQLITYSHSSAGEDLVCNAVESVGVLSVQLRICSLASFGSPGTTETVNDDFSMSSVPAGMSFPAYAVL